MERFDAVRDALEVVRLVLALTSPRFSVRVGLRPDGKAVLVSAACCLCEAAVDYMMVCLTASCPICTASQLDPSLEGRKVIVWKTCIEGLCNPVFWFMIDLCCSHNTY